MLLPDVNVLLHAYREDAADHPQYKAWLDATLASPEPLGICDPVLTDVLRIVTHPRIFVPPTPIGPALEYAGRLRDHANVARVAPGERHWALFSSLCREADARGNLIPDAFLAALAIESGSELVTVDRDFARFPGLRWRHPLAGTQ
jgi:toxin-antitoxin system PIN domain toxin